MFLRRATGYWFGGNKGIPDGYGEIDLNIGGYLFLFPVKGDLLMDEMSSRTFRKFIVS